MYGLLLKYFTRTTADILIVGWYVFLLILVCLFYTTNGADFKYIAL